MRPPHTALRSSVLHPEALSVALLISITRRPADPAAMAGRRGRASQLCGGTRVSLRGRHRSRRARCDAGNVDASTRPPSAGTPSDHENEVATEVVVLPEY